MSEWIMVLIVVALVFAATKVPAAGDWLGRTVLGDPKPPRPADQGAGRGGQGDGATGGPGAAAATSSPGPADPGASGSPRPG